jgi:hypothetical protein
MMPDQPTDMMQSPQCLAGIRLPPLYAAIVSPSPDSLPRVAVVA